MKKICTINPTNWTNLITLLKPLEKQGSINIQKSLIFQDVNKGVAILYANISTLIGENVTFDIINPGRFIKLFKLLESKDKDVNIFEDEENESFVIISNNIKLFLPKHIDSISSANKKPNLTEYKSIGKCIILDKNHKRDIDTLIRSEAVDFVDLLISDDQFVGFEVKEMGIYLFTGYENTNMDKKKADIVLKSLAFMLFPGEEFEINVGKKNNEYILVTRINTGFLNVQLIENLEINDSEDGFDLI